MVPSPEFLSALAARYAVPAGVAGLAALLIAGE